MRLLVHQLKDWILAYYTACRRVASLPAGEAVVFVTSILLTSSPQSAPMLSEAPEICLSFPKYSYAPGLAVIL